MVPPSDGLHRAEAVDRDEVAARLERAAHVADRGRRAGHGIDAEDLAVVGARGDQDVVAGLADRARGNERQAVELAGEVRRQQRRLRGSRVDLVDRAERRPEQVAVLVDRDVGHLIGGAARPAEVADHRDRERVRVHAVERRVGVGVDERHHVAARAGVRAGARVRAAAGIRAAARTGAHLAVIGATRDERDGEREPGGPHCGAPYYEICRPRPSPRSSAVIHATGMVADSWANATPRASTPITPALPRVRAWR